MTDTNQKRFVSSIKIRGLHFFPPVISEQKRMELQKYKQQAINIERRLQHYKDLEKSLQGLLNLRPVSQLSHTSLSEISFNDTNSHLKALGISPKSENASNRSLKHISLSTDIIDITEYSSNGIKIIDSIQHFKQGQHENLNEYDHINLSPSTSNNNNNNNVSIVTEITPVKPRLLRSNSYTLENPSPILLAHLEKCSENKSDDNLKLTDEITATKSWTSSDDNYTSLENSDFSSQSTVYQKESTEKIENQNDKLPIQLPSPNVSNQNAINLISKSSPQIELIHADISVQHVTVHNNIAEEKEILKSTFELSDPNNQLLEILRNIPEDYSKRIIDLIEKERLEQVKEMEAARREKDNSCDTDLKLSCEDLKCENKPGSYVGSPEKMSSSAGSISPSVWSQNSQSIQMFDLECDNKSTNDYYNSDGSPHSKIGESEDITIHCKKKLDFNKRQDITKLHNMKREWAASVISAYVKGYLTRRLLKTERVQALIATIRDALMCALQLHSAENIDETDVELHRRLINQVTAACYAFHDIFFSLSISEQMYMIATDRQHKLEKAKRPLSAPQPRRPSIIKKKQRRSSLSKSVTNV